MCFKIRSHSIDDTASRDPIGYWSQCTARSRAERGADNCTIACRIYDNMKRQAIVQFYMGIVPITIEVLWCSVTDFTFLSLFYPNIHPNLPPLKHIPLLDQVSERSIYIFYL